MKIAALNKFQAKFYDMDKMKSEAIWNNLRNEYIRYNLCERQLAIESIIMRMHVRFKNRRRSPDVTNRIESNNKFGQELDIPWCWRHTNDKRIDEFFLLNFNFSKRKVKSRKFTSETFLVINVTEFRFKLKYHQS